MRTIQAAKLFKDLFKENNIKIAYFNNIAHKALPGIDRVTRSSFEKNLDMNLKHISKNTIKGKYKFVPYKEKLLLKGKSKLPRTISIPSIRDKVTLNILNKILAESFSKKVTTRLTQSIIDDLKKAIKSGNYNYFIKIDIESFYDNINHDILVEKIGKRIKKKEIIDLIKKAINNPTIVAGAERKESLRGVPQGISISNILANIYLAEVDQRFTRIKDIQYFRYVDDILILCNEKNNNRLKSIIQKEFTEKLILTVNDKEDSGKLTKGFEYLGYKFTELSNNIYGFSVRDKNLLKLESSLIKIFADYKNDKKGQVFLWKLNLRITGFVLDDRKYGWLFFYSMIDDKSKLYHLDWFIGNKLCNLFKVPDNLKKRIKKFVFAYFEITKKRGKSSYIPRAEDYSIKKQKRILMDIFSFKKEYLKTLSDEQIEIVFKNKMYISVKDLERDVQSIS